MSTFTKGRKVRALRDTESYGAGVPIKKGEVLEVSATSDVDGQLFNAWRPDVPFLHIALAKDDFETADATPAPLDPKSVHVGDTVTVRFKETGEEITTKAYQPKDLTADSEWVYILGWPLNKPMGHGLAVKYFELIGHQPAPEPEPEWKPGTVANIETAADGPLRAMLTEGNTWSAENGETYMAGDVAEADPLVVIDPAAVDVDALTTTFHNASHYGVDLPLEGAAYLARVARTFFVGGESR